MSQYWQAKCWLFLCFIGLSSSALNALGEVWPASVVNLEIQDKGGPTEGYVNYWADVDGVDVDKAIKIGRFQQQGRHQITLGARKHWYSMVLENPTEHSVKYFIATGLPSTPAIHAYWVNGEQIDNFFTLLGRDGFDARPVQYPLLFIPVELPAHTIKYLLVEHQSLASYPLALRFLHAESLQKKMSLFTLARGIVFGALIVFFILFFMQAVATPASALIFYCCYIFGLIFLVGQIFGYNFAYLWPHSGSFNHIFTPLITGITYGFYYLFSAHLFKLNIHNKKLYRATLGLAYAAFLLALVNLFYDGFWLLAALALIGLPIPVIIGLWARSKKFTSANLFLAGSILHCSLSYLLALECLGIHLGYSYYLFSFLSVGQLFDLGLFSTALLRQASQMRKELYEQLEQRVRDAEALALSEQKRSNIAAQQQSVALNVASTTHDLTQPLAAIRFALALIDDQKNTGAKEHIVKTLNYTEELLRSMTQHGKENYQHAREQVASSVMIAAVKERHENKFLEKGLNFRLHLGVLEFECMPVLVQRILDNLLVNALRNTQVGGVMLSVRARREAILLQVWDTGVGMSPLQVEKFKQPFTQSNPQALQGYGLGLFIVKTLAEKAGYGLNIRSVLNRGTCVSVSIPN